jgi:hypothetical protein
MASTCRTAAPWNTIPQQWELKVKVVLKCSAQQRWYGQFKRHQEIRLQRDQGIACVLLVILRIYSVVTTSDDHQVQMETYLN